ncbi:hypothetical protein AMATHDRAFT_142659 [Amanita thiersii Skay4041]|uniref:Mitochondrial inner membrane protease subunit 2 n=1 Tax=Amanita thiersii Skay4041 TaxID=703135 RepID=A0A2A9NUM9_9AGAR|nr:hypothetical protein AMATHDRAFT_142659 [Amanita thiersii Skay4041]
MVFRTPIRSLLYWSPSVICIAHTVSVKQISGRSMQPTLNPDTSAWRDIAVFDQFSTHIMRPCRRDDIVALRSPVDSKRMLVKRIVALEGDLVKTRPPCAEQEVRVPPGHAWIEGDEPFRTDDSNLFGPVPLGLIESRLMFIIWPLNRFGSLAVHIPKDRSSPAFRRAMDQLQKEKIRHSRVVAAIDSGSIHSSDS